MPRVAPVCRTRSAARSAVSAPCAADRAAMAFEVASGMVENPRAFVVFSSWVRASTATRGSIGGAAWTSKIATAGAATGAGATGAGVTDGGATGGGDTGGGDTGGGADVL